jgi:alpha/beta superfamily hydrolase
MLVVQGAVDPMIQARERADELIAAASHAQTDVILLEGANHYFDHRHRELSDCIMQWLGRTSSGSEREGE